MATSEVNQHFLGLILSLQQSVWVYLGKIASPGSGKLERNLEAAKDSIDLLEVLEEKTRGNLSTEEAKLLSSLLLELRMNYVDELGKEPASTTEATADTEPPSATETASDTGSTSSATETASPAEKNRSESEAGE